jgi:hypothetical protein
MAYSNLYANFYSWGQRASAALSAVWHFLPSRLYLLGLVLLQAIAWLQAYFIFSNLSGDFLVLHYNVDFGIDLVGPPTRIFLYPLLGLGLAALNIILAASFSRHKDFTILVHSLLATALAFGLFLDLALWFIYLVNFR